MAGQLVAVEYAGHDAVLFDAGALRVAVATGFGPRIIGLEREDSANLLAVLPDAWQPGVGGERYLFRGGHRLWVAPEVAAVTYRPDDEPVGIELVDGSLQATGSVDDRTGLRRAMQLSAFGGDGLEVRHLVRNDGGADVRLAPWAITQLPLGGRAWLPLGPRAFEDGSPLPDRVVVLWPYTDLSDPRLRLDNGVAEITATAGAGDRVKVGSSASRLAYLRDGWLLEKQAELDPSAEYADFGAAAQVYADERFLELETLGPLVELARGGEVVHVERWTVSRSSEDAVRGRLGIG